MNPEPNDLQIETVLRQMMDAAREWATLTSTLDKHKDPDPDMPPDPRREALRVGDVMARMWSRRPNHLAVPLADGLNADACRLVAKLLAGTQIHVSRVVVLASPHSARPMRRETVYAHLCEPSLLTDRLAEVTQGYHVTLVETY